MKSIPHSLALLAIGALLGMAGSSLLQRPTAQAAAPSTPPVAGRSLLGPATPAETTGQATPPPNQKVPVESQVINLSKLIARSSGVGTRRDLFDGPTRTLVNLEGHISTLDPGNVSHAPHQHVNEEIIILTKGKLEVGINNKISTALPGDLMLFSSNDWHNVKSVGDVPAEYYVLNWSSTPKPGFVPPTIEPPTTFPSATTGSTGASR